MAVRVLVVDDQSHHRDSIKYQLDKAGYRVTKAGSGAEALAALESNEYEVALVDYKMAHMDGIELLKRIRARWPHVAVILMTGYASIPTAVEAIKTGACDFLETPFKPEDLLAKLKRVFSDVDRNSSSGSGKVVPFDDIVGRTPAIIAAVDLAKNAATSDKPVTILGELGSGRESLARAIHATSARHAGPFVPVRCAGGGELAAELFGSANGASPAKLAEANGGTVYLDEVFDLSADAQGRLLRFLQDGEIVRNGAPPQHGDARVIASTSKDPDEAIAGGVLRNDLWLRLKAMLIRVPPLRERTTDIPLLVQNLSRRLKPRAAGQPVRFSKDALAMLASHPFRGNLRELEDIVGQAIALARNGEVDADTLGILGIRADAVETTDSSTMKSHLELEEKRVIQDELRRNPHNLRAVARNLKISRTTLWRKMKRYGLETA
jgi:two-component system, NtrC family, response regulator HydG